MYYEERFAKQALDRATTTRMSTPPDDSAKRARNPRLLLAAGVAAAVLLGVVLLIVAGSGSDDETGAAKRVTRATLTLERAIRPDNGRQELLVSLPGPQLNTPDINHGSTVVGLRCVDASGADVIRRQVDWPLIEEPGFPPHIHHPATPRTLERIRRCTLTGTGIAFTAATSGALPAPG